MSDKGFLLISRNQVQGKMIKTAKNRASKPKYVSPSQLILVGFKSPFVKGLINKTIYIAVGLKRDGKKEVLGLWLEKNESAAFWMTVLTDLRARGVEDILILSF